MPNQEITDNILVDDHVQTIVCSLGKLNTFFCAARFHQTFFSRYTNTFSSFSSLTSKYSLMSSILIIRNINCWSPKPNPCLSVGHNLSHKGLHPAYNLSRNGGFFKIRPTAITLHPSPSCPICFSTGTLTFLINSPVASYRG